MFEEMSNMQIIRPMNFAALGLGAAFTVVYGVVDPMAAFAEIREVEAEGYYRMGDGMEERMDIAQQRAIADATRKAAEKAGVFVESFSSTYMGQITRDEVHAIAATVLDVKEPVKVIPEVFADGQAIRYHAFVTAVVDTANIEKMLNKSGDDKADMVRRNKEMEEELAKVNAEIERLKAEHQRATEAEKQRINEEVKQNERRFEAWTWCEKASAHFNKAEYIQAIACYQKAIEIDPTCAEALGNIAASYARLGRYDDAIAACKRSIELNPKLMAPWCNLGMSYDKLGKYEQAIECLQKAIELSEGSVSDRDMATLWNNLGSAYDNIGNRDQALECYQKSVAMDPKHYMTWSNLGIFYNAANDNRKAVECYQKAIENLGPDKEYAATVWANAGFAYYSLGEYPKALEHFQRSAELYPSDTNAHLGIGWSNAAMGNYEAAFAAYQKTTEIDPKFAPPWSAMSDIYIALGNYEKAAECCQKAIELDPNYADPWHKIGYAYYMLGDRDKAIECMQRAVELDPNNAGYKSDLNHLLGET